MQYSMQYTHVLLSLYVPTSPSQEPKAVHDPTPTVPYWTKKNYTKMLVGWHVVQYEDQGTIDIVHTHKSITGTNIKTRVITNITL